MLVGSDLQMAKSRSEVVKSSEYIERIPKGKDELSMMKQGYKEMAAINLALSNLYFDVESEAQSYYDRIAESE